MIRHFDKEIFSEKYYYWYLYQFNILDGKDNEQFFKFFLIRLFINGENSVNMSINNFFGIFGTKSEKLDSVDELRKIQKFNLVGVEDKIREITNYNDYIKIIQEEIKLVGITDNATAEIILKYFEYDKENDKDFLFNFRNKFFKIYEATAVKQNFLDQKIKSYQNYSFISNLKVVNDLYKNTYPILKESIFEDISEKIKYFFEVYVNEFDPFQFSVEIDNYDECCSKLEEVIRISNLNGIEFEVLAYLKEINKINLKLDTNDHQKIFDLAKDKIDTFDNEFFEKNLRKKIGCTDINRKNTSDFLLAFIKSKYDNIDKKQNMGDIIFENIKNYICNELYKEPIKIDGNNIGIDDEPITVEDISNAIFSDNVNLTALKSYIETKSLGHINRYNLFQISFSDDQLPELNKKRNENLSKLREFIDQYINNNSNEDDIRNALNIIKAYFYVYDEGIYQNYYNSNLIGGEGHNNYVNDLEPSFNDFKSFGYLYGEDLDLGSFLDEINKYSFNDPLDLLVEIIKYEFLKISNRNNKEYPKDILEKFIFGKYDKHISNFFDQNPHNMHLPYHTVKEELFFVRFVKLNHVIDTFVAEGKFNSIDRNDIIDILLELKDVLDYYEKEDIWLDIDDIYTHLVNAFDYYYNGSNKDKGLVDLINQKYNITSESESSQSKIINRRPQFKFLKKLKENEKMVYYLINLLKDMNIIKDPECLLRLLFSKSYIIYGKGFLLGEKSKPIIPYYHEELVDDHKFSKLVTSNDFSLSKFISILDKFINPGNPDSNDKTKTPLFIMKNYLNSIQVGNYRFNSKIKLFNKDKEKLYKEYQNHIELIKYHESNINDLDAKSNIKSKLADNKQIKKSKVMYIGVENYLDYFYSLNFKNSEELGKLLVEVNGTKKENEFDFKFLRYDNYYRYSQQLQKVCYNLYRLERESIGMTIDIDWYDENTKKMFIDYYKTKLRRNELFDIIPKKDDEVDFFNAKKEELIKRYETYIEIYNNIIVVLDNILLIEKIDFNNNKNYDDLIRKFSEYYQNINKNIESFESIIIEKEEEYRKKYTKDENEKIKEDIFKLINDYLIYSGKIDISKLIQEYEEAQSLLKFNVTVNNDLISEISQKHSTDFPNENTFGTIYNYLKNKDDTELINKLFYSHINDFEMKTKNELDESNLIQRENEIVAIKFYSEQIRIIKDNISKTEYEFYNLDEEDQLHYRNSFEEIIEQYNNDINDYNSRLKNIYRLNILEEGEQKIDFKKFVENYYYYKNYSYVDSDDAIARFEQRREKKITNFKFNEFLFNFFRYFKEQEEIEKFINKYHFGYDELKVLRTSFFKYYHPDKLEALNQLTSDNSLEIRNKFSDYDPIFDEFIDSRDRQIQNLKFELEILPNKIITLGEAKERYNKEKEDINNDNLLESNKNIDETRIRRLNDAKDYMVEIREIINYLIEKLSKLKGETSNIRKGEIEANINNDIETIKESCNVYISKFKKSNESIENDKKIFDRIIPYLDYTLEIIEYCSNQEGKKIKNQKKNLLMIFYIHQVF